MLLQPFEIYSGGAKDLNSVCAHGHVTDSPTNADIPIDGNVFVEGHRKVFLAEIAPTCWSQKSMCVLLARTQVSHIVYHRLRTQEPLAAQQAHRGHRRNH